MPYCLLLRLLRLGGKRRSEQRSEASHECAALHLFNDLIRAQQQRRRGRRWRSSKAIAHPISAKPPPFPPVQLVESYLTGALFPQILQRTERLGCHAT